MSDEIMTEVVKVIRSHALRFVDRQALREASRVVGGEVEVLASLPRYVSVPRWGRDRPSTFALTGAYVEHTWNGESWHEARTVTGVKLKKDGGAWGYGGEAGIRYRDLKGDLPSEVWAFWESCPPPETELVLTEVPTA